MSTIAFNTLHELHHNINLCRLISTGKILLSNHYEVLNLSRNCSAKEIKDSFIKLSKEHHPDVSKSEDSHKKFLQINEAYKILSKAESRQHYDLGFSTPITYSQDGKPAFYYRRKSGSNPWRDSSFYQNREPSEDEYYKHNSYYGIKGLRKVSNVTIVLFCLSLTFIGVGLQVLVIRNSFTFKRDKLIESSNRAQDALKEVKLAASLNGNDLQMELLKLRFKHSATNKSE